MYRAYISLAFCLVILLGAVGGTCHDSSLAAQAAPPQVDPAPLRAQLTELFEVGGARAMLATVRRGEQEIVSLALGESMTGVPASLDDHVRIGGVSELFWGTLVMRLVERGDIKLEDKISRWLPDLLSADKVTVGMLLNNLGGYKDYVVNPAFVEKTLKDPFHSYTRDQIIAFAVGDGQMNFEPGTAFKYSHTEFTTLGKVIEKATGRTMEDLYQELIFSQVDLPNTGYMRNAELPQPVLHVYSHDRDVYEDCTYWDPTWTGDSGPLYSTLGDLAKWARVHGQGKLLASGSFARLRAKPEVATNDNLYFAGGFMVANGWFCQNPSFNGYSGAYGYLPEEDLTVIVYTSQGRDPESDRQAFKIFKQVVTTLTPERPIPF